MNTHANFENDSPLLRWGVLGTARVARQVMIPGIQQSRNGRVLAIASRNLQRARQMSASFQVERAYGSYEELLEDDDVQAVYIPLPNTLHREWTVKAAACGRHVFCEKPLACNAAEAAEMVDACTTNGVLLMEAVVSRFHPHNVQIKAILDQGRIGRPLRMTAVHSSDRPSDSDIRLSRDLRGGILMDKGCYCINTARYLFGSEPVSVFASAEFGDRSHVDERVIATLSFPDGAVAQFDCNFSLASSCYRQSYQVFGESGHIHVPTGFSQVKTYRHGTIVDSAYYLSEDDATDPRVQRIDCDGAHIWQVTAEYFADCVLNDRPLSPPAENGLANMKVIDAIYASARQGRPVEIV